MKNNDNYYKINQLFYKECLKVDEDLEFIVELVSSNMSGDLIHRFQDFLAEVDPPLELFKDLILNLVKKLFEKNEEEFNKIRDVYRIDAELSNLIALLYDRVQNDVYVAQECLDLWDLMFEKQLGNMRRLSQSIMDS